ncbi:isoprenylcysteine carboxylmethyltransferase family protein [Candidatus Borrarchaeum sp.]|uniref:methyltransferase family protein n=1 Tax=Candidatus Borrarchaeum sp. TaxID=2846742 RepID=UPI00257D4FD6|nr:isoprenylcysteine carboxylmethyltransferase family protein [Candidatus Borrarchaeum sp.]
MKMNLSYIQIFLLGYLVLYLVLFLISLIIPKRAGKDSKGVAGGYPSGKRIFASLSSLLFIGIIILYVINEDSANWFLKIPLIFNEFFQIMGMAIIGFGFVLETVGILTLGVNFRMMLPKERTNLVTHGIYAHIRHPIGLSVILFVIGLFFIVPNLLSLVNLVCNVLVYNSKANFEEHYLLKVHKEKYENYKQRVGKFFPKLTRQTSTTSP